MSGNYWTHQRSDGKWGSKREGNFRDTKTFDTQKESWDYTRNKARENKSEAFLQGENGKIRERNSYGNDPYPPKG